jgi:hypothetical protein
MQMRKDLAITTAAMVLCGGQVALAGSQGYVVSNWAPAMNNVDDSGCPQGRNPGPRDVMIASLKERGMPQDQIDKLTDPTKLNSTVYGQYMGRRGNEGGQAASIYTHPLSAPDTNIKLDQAKEGFGFNLDGRDGPLDYTDPLTHETGVDNVAARVFGCFDRTRGTYKAPPGNWSYRWTHYTEGNSWLVEVTNNSSKPLNFQSEDNVTVNFYRGMQPPIRNGVGYQRNVTYTIDPDTRLKSLTSFKGKIRNGLFTADVTPEFRMIASPRIHPVFDFKSVHMRMTFNPDGSMEAFVGGYVPIDQVYFPFGSYGIYAEYSGGMDVSGVYHALQKYADTDIDLDPKTHKRTRISQTYQLEAAPAFLTRVSSAVE